MDTYLVGGAVRDRLLGLPVRERDFVVVGAVPDDLMAQGFRPVGKDFPVFLHPQTGEEYALARTERKSGRGHTGFVVHAAPDVTLDEDLARRDFTINAIAMDASGAILDPVGGRNDLANRTIRAIGDPAIRFEEDALRMLRAFRFAAKLDFEIEPKTKRAIAESRDRLKQLPTERILDEIRTMLAQTHADRALRDMLECRLDDVFLQWAEGIRLFANADGRIPSFETFFAVSLLNLDGDAIDAWRFSNREKTKIRRLIDLIQVTEADSFTPMLLYCYGLDLCLQADLANAARFRRPPKDMQIRLLDAALPIRRPCDLAFKGDDLLQLTGVHNARVIGQVIEEMIEAILNGSLPNERDPLSAFALERIQTLLTAEETL